MCGNGWKCLFQWLEDLSSPALFFVVLLFKFIDEAAFFSYHKAPKAKPSLFREVPWMILV